MKTLEEIKDEVAQEYGWKNWSSCYGEDGITNSIINEVAKRYAKEVAREALKNASENACLIESIRNSAVYDTIDKSSILNNKNIPEI